MNDLMIPETSSVPEYIRKAMNPAANEAAAAGISTGALPRIKLSAKQFVLVDGNGEEKPVKAADMFVAPDGNAYLNCIVLSAKKEIVKAWYAQAYNPAAEGVAPDCFSNDGVRPDPLASAIQCDSCATCPHNAFGSGRDQNGNATGGKACSDNKILAVYVPNKGIYKFKIPPASLKNFGLYVKNLNSRNIPLTHVMTLIGFDDTQSYPIVIFTFGGFVPENLIGKVTALVESPETLDIITDKISSAVSAPSLPAPPEAKKEAPPTPPVPDLGLTNEPPPAPPAPKKEEAQPAPPAAAGPSDDDLARSLGLI